MNNPNKVNKFYRYKRGQFVIVNFSGTTGNELAGVHPAIVLTKDDNPYNGCVTVIPLSSKAKKRYIPLGHVLTGENFRDLGNAIMNHLRIDAIEAELALDLKSKIFSSEEELEEAERDLALAIISSRPDGYIEDGKAILKVEQKYDSMFKCSYAAVDSITTISKMKIRKPLPLYDPLKCLVVQDEVLDKIDAAIIQRLTGRLPSESGN